MHFIKVNRFSSVSLLSDTLNKNINFSHNVVPHIDNIITQFTSGGWAGQADEGGICDPVVGGGGGQMRRDIKERSHEDHNIMYYLLLQQL